MPTFVFTDQGSHDPAEARSQLLPVDTDAHSEADSLFGDEPDAEGEPDNTSPDAPPLSVPSAGPPQPLPVVQSPKPPPIPAPAPKNAPPILDSASYAAFSPDIIMTAAMDGQVVLWDCRVPSGAGFGVGRLWMSEKTPPWCLSVRHQFYPNAIVPCDPLSAETKVYVRLAGPLMVGRSSPEDGMALSTCGM